MKKRNKKKTGLIAIILILVILISIGYASISTNLTIGGNATITAQNWLIYFTNIQPTTGSVTPTTAPTTSGTSTTTLTWVVSLDTPGQFYEYTVDVKNDGSIDAMIGTLSNSTLTTNQAKYLDYTVTYSDGATIEQYDKLEAGHTETLRVRVEFKADPEELPSSASAITLNYASNYVQADTTHAKARNTANVTPSGPTVHNLAQAGDIQVGDTVNYSPASGSITLTSDQTGYKDWSTQAPISQTISTASNTSMTWKVFSVDQASGTVKIVAETDSQQDQYLHLQGKTGFANGISVLNSVAAIFGTGYGAKANTARSITMEDIATAIGLDYTSSSNPYLIYTGGVPYGTSHTYTKGNLFTKSGNSYSATTTTATAENPITLTSDGPFNIYNAINNCSNTTLKNMLLGNYWCATQYLDAGDTPIYSMYFVDSYMDDSYLYMYRTDTDEEDESPIGSPTIMTILELDPTVQMEKTNNVWNFITE